jgi:hypothetical protein
VSRVPARGRRTGVPRATLVAQAQALRASGTLIDDIASQMGVSRSYASELIRDPDGSAAAARKRSYARRCACGRSMDMGSQRCATCATAAYHTERYWTRDRIIAAFQEFHSVMGRAPAATDVPKHARSMAKRISKARLAEAYSHGVHLPVPHAVKREFGGWRAAVAAAGLQQLPQGGAAWRRYEVDTVPPMPPSRRVRLQLPPVDPGAAGAPPREPHRLRVHDGTVCPSCGDMTTSLDAATGWCGSCAREHRQMTA